MIISRTRFALLSGGQRMFQITKELLGMSLKHPGLLPHFLRIKRQKKTFLNNHTLPGIALHIDKVHQRFQSALNIAEFGVGRGGSAIVMAWMIRKYGGHLSLYDVFERIPPPTDKDGLQALERYDVIKNNEAADYYGNIPDLLTVIRKEIHQVCDPNQVAFIQGRYEDTLPEDHSDQRFHFVHIDCDWYESSKVVFSFLENRIMPGAIIQIDDYSYWAGSKLAVDETSWLQPYHRKIVGGALVLDTHVRHSRATKAT